MHYKVVYFSRTGNSKRVAIKIANKLSCEAVEISDNMNWKGVFGFIKGGYYASRNKDVVINMKGIIDETDEILLVTPLWAGGPAPAIRTFLKKRNLSEINLVVTSISSHMKNLSGFKSITDIIRNKKNEDLVIDELCTKLK